MVCKLMTRTLLLTACILVATIGVTSADTVVLQDGVDGYDGTENNSLKSPYAHANFGGDATMAVANKWKDWRYTGILSFGVTGVVAGGLTTAAGDATITITRSTGKDKFTGVQMWALNDADVGWVEGSQSGGTESEVGASDPSGHTHDKDAGGQAWAGGDGPGKKYDWTGYTYERGPDPGDAGYTLLDEIASSSEGVAYDFTVPQAVLQGWLDGTNPGVLFSAEQPDNWYQTSSQGYRTQTTWHSNEAATVSQRPKLMFEVIPEPATLIVLGLGGLAMLLRRRRQK